MKINSKTMRHLLSLIESKRYQDIRMLLFTILFNTPNHDFCRLVDDSKEGVCELVETPGGQIKIHDFTFEKINF